MEIEREKQLVENAKKGIDSFGELYDYYFPRIYGYLLKRTQNKEEAEDITSETFKKAILSIKSFKWRGLSFGSWLYKIAINCLKDSWRKSNKVFINNIEENQKSLGAEDKNILNLDNKLDSEKLLLIIKNLPLDYQEAISLKFYEDLPNKDIAKILKINENNLAVKIYRGLKMLRRLSEEKILFNENGGRL